MFSYHVRSDFRPIPHVSHRFWVTKDAGSYAVIDRFNDDVRIDPELIDGELAVTLPIATLYGSVVRLDLLVALAFKPLISVETPECLKASI
jgi:hypothetical protein